MILGLFFFFFFFQSRSRHTSWNCDWSSDVSSSVLGGQRPAGELPGKRTSWPPSAIVPEQLTSGPLPATIESVSEIGRASCRERVWISGGAMRVMTIKVKEAGSGVCCIRREGDGRGE